MAEHRDPHPDLTAYLLGELDRERVEALEAHARTCERCRADLDELRGVVDLMRTAASPVEVPPDLEERTFAAVARAGRPGRRRRPTRRASPRPRRRLGALVAAGVVSAALGVGVGLLVARDDAASGSLELRAQLTAPRGGTARAQAEVRKLGIGRTIELRSDDLPILPTGEFYELWFVGPGDRRGRRNRISGGTFHPDPQGRSAVTLTAAVDPKRYPVISVTAERGGGDPGRLGREVLRARTSGR